MILKKLNNDKNLEWANTAFNLKCQLLIDYQHLQKNNTCTDRKTIFVTELQVHLLLFNTNYKHHETSQLK